MMVRVSPKLKTHSNHYIYTFFIFISSKISLKLNPTFSKVSIEQVSALCSLVIDKRKVWVKQALSYYI